VFNLKIHTRELDVADFEKIKLILHRDGANEWNYITDESVEAQFELIRAGKALAVLAEEDEIAGFAILIFKDACPYQLSKYSNLSAAAYINDVVVNPNYSGKGIGSALLDKAIELAKNEQCSKVYIERHEENLASAGMMRKASFELVDTFFDPDRRTTGSKNTTVLVKST